MHFFSSENTARHVPRNTAEEAGNSDSEVATERDLEKDSKEEAVTSTGDSMNGDIKEPAKPDEENTNRDA